MILGISDGGYLLLWIVTQVLKGNRELDCCAWTFKDGTFLQWKPMTPDVTKHTKKNQTLQPLETPGQEWEHQREVSAAVSLPASLWALPLADSSGGWLPRECGIWSLQNPVQPRRGQGREGGILAEKGHVHHPGVGGGRNSSPMSLPKDYCSEHGGPSIICCLVWKQGAKQDKLTDEGHREPWDRVVHRVCPALRCSELIWLCLFP